MWATSSACIWSGSTSASELLDSYESVCEFQRSAKVWGSLPTHKSPLYTYLLLSVVAAREQSRFLQGPDLQNMGWHQKSCGILASVTVLRYIFLPPFESSNLFRMDALPKFLIDALSDMHYFVDFHIETAFLLTQRFMMLLVSIGLIKWNRVPEGATTYLRYGHQLVVWFHRWYDSRCCF
jgi:hypothetical protein